MQHKKNPKTVLVITSGHRWSYFEWFLFGFKILQQKKLIDIKYKLPLGSSLLMKTTSPTISKVLNKIISNTENDSYNMEGYLLFPNGEKKSFCIDSADSPFLFDLETLKRVNIYFKMQCPEDITSNSFKLTNTVSFPWTDHAHKNKSLKLTDRGERKVIPSLMPYKNKIKPLMIGPRQLAIGCSYKSLKLGYDNYIKYRKSKKINKIMCYFGNAEGPGYEKAVSNPDLDWEKDIMGFFRNKISHPNKKRAIVAKYISEQSKSDARIISKGNSDTNAKRNEKLVIPLKDFCRHISKFQYNMNVSGYRLSIPNRFIESFMVGTAIFTDKLHVMWYKPFDAEVKESVNMGYLPIKNVNWNQFEKDLNNLPKSNPGQVIDAFEKKWAPEVVARYIIDTVANS
ncbi:hypothetical protein [Lactobacillus crispatus]|uniref:hypothetical protein n=1 Tax=Lactobacillus crispatus TaxID=47770 RepID=UPI0015DE187E|nr:hypothetical protein [Lactobacillus crispatus]QLK32460.1 hypothetical protein H0G71_08815 [Lactobacillus crispatus]